MRWSGISMRDRIKLGASGKIITAFDMRADPGARRRLVQFGARLHVRARLHPVAVVPHRSLPDRRRHPGPYAPALARVPDKAERVFNFHRSTVKALAEVIAAAGLAHPDELRPRHFSKRVSTSRVERFDQIYRFLEPGELIGGTEDHRYKDAWTMARADSFDAAL